MSTSKSVKVVSGDSLETSGGQTEGMIRQNALQDVSDQLCGSRKIHPHIPLIAVMIAKPHSSSGVHHHGDQDTIVYGVRGVGAIVSDGGKSKQVVGPGDWGLIPAGAKHQEVNEGDEEVAWVIVRGGRMAEVANLDELDQLRDDRWSMSSCNHVYPCNEKGFPPKTETCR